MLNKFCIRNVLQMDMLFIESELDVVIDSGLFQVMTDEERPVFTQQVHRLLRKGGKYFMLCFSTGSRANTRCPEDSKRL